jgi:glutamate N-acetyltransferase/amino-acid N-acetyltransferase
MMAGSAGELLWRTIKGGVCAPQGFLAAGVQCGIKNKGRDLAVLLSERPATVVGAFTTNCVKAAHVLLCQQRAAGRLGRAVVINSGNANCLTGEQGRRNAERTAEIAAQALGLEPRDVFVASTGPIGVQLPMDKVEQGIKEAGASLSRSGGAAAARAIMTTDTKPKEIAVEFTVEEKAVRVGAMAKGAGMICPHMATMICVVTTDAAVPVESLELSLRWAVDRSFNCISVDGDMSTNDTVLLFANGASGVRLQKPEQVQRFQQALDHVTLRMAQAIVQDGEGATKMMEIRVAGAREYADAHRIALTIANSLLVKTAVFGADPNWGRFLAAAGRAGVEIEQGRIDLFFGDLQVVRGGEGLPYDEALARQALLGPEVKVEMDLHLGPHSATLFTCDLTPKYVRFNSAYTT